MIPLCFPTPFNALKVKDLPALDNLNRELMAGEDETVTNEPIRAYNGELSDFRCLLPQIGPKMR
jgi:hypothetical protein